jgi:hypothetical protein
MHSIKFFLYSLLLLPVCTVSQVVAKPSDAQKQKQKEYQVAKQAHALLEKWTSEGTASGLSGTVWDNRDDGHSKINLDQLPGMIKFQYSPSEVKSKGWGLQTGVMDETTVGNSSTAHKHIDKGSQPRCAYSSPIGLSVLRKQYRANNIYIYPSHMDHIAGNQREGKGQTKEWGSGRGDMYPTNTPFVIVSQGSSGTDKPFIRAISWTIGSFQRDVRMFLEEHGLLMPTVQMLLRGNQTNIGNSSEYLTGLAHPVVFDGKNIDVINMMDAAHRMTLKDIPPLVQLKVLSEDTMVAGRDFIGPNRLSEKLYESPELIARIWRGYSRSRKMRISAGGTINPSALPLKYHWVVLRGPAKNAEIRWFQTDGSEVEITFSYPYRSESRWIDGMWSNRLELGVFAETKKGISAPAFITWVGLDNEERTYTEDGTIQSIDYGTGRYVDPRLSVGMAFRDTFQWNDGKIIGIFRQRVDGTEEQVGPDGRTIKSGPKVNRDNHNSNKKKTSGSITQKHNTHLTKWSVPTKVELEDARSSLGPLLQSDLNGLVRLANKKEAAELYLILMLIINEAAHAGNVAITAGAMHRISAHYEVDGLDERMRSIRILVRHEALNQKDKGDLCKFALNTSRLAHAIGRMQEANESVLVALTLGRLTRDTELQRDIVRQVIYGME